MAVCLDGWAPDLVFLFLALPSASSLFLFQAPRHPISSLFLAHFRCSWEDAQQEAAWFSVLSSELMDAELGQPCHKPAEEQPAGKPTLPVVLYKFWLEGGSGGGAGGGSTVDGR